MKTILGWVLFMVAMIGVGVGVEAGIGPAGPTGAVTGFIEPCEGLPIPGLPYAAGTVTAYRGEQTYRPIAQGAYEMVLPTMVVARQHIATDQRFDLSLMPGDYLLVASYEGQSGVGSFLDVQITAGKTLRINIPNRCK